jgi:S1-C subfamily serine protease
MRRNTSRGSPFTRVGYNSCMNVPPLPEAPTTTSKRPRSPLLPLALAAVLGGGVAAASVVAVTDRGATKTVVVSGAPAPVSTAAAKTVTVPAGTSETITAIYKDAAPGVVTVSRGQGTGSGFVIDRDGYVLTNAHVVDATGAITVSFSNGDRVDAKLVGTDASTDVALLKVSEPSDALHPIPLGDSATIQVGDPVVAIGNPFGYDRTITSGIVSAVARQIESPNGFPINNAIQTDAAINHGNSGGPLLNMQGQVVGINSQIADSGVNANVGVGFAIPINLVKSIETDLRAHGSVQHAYLGVTLSDIDPALVASLKDLPVSSGVMVAAVSPNSPASAAGLKGGNNRVVLDGQTYVIGGDIVTAINGTPVKTVTDLQSAIQQQRAGDVVTLSVVHNDGSKAAVKVTLGHQPASAATQQAPQQQPVDPFGYPLP